MKTVQVTQYQTTEMDIPEFIHTEEEALAFLESSPYLPPEFPDPPQYRVDLPENNSDAKLYLVNLRLENHDVQLHVRAHDADHAAREALQMVPSAIGFSAKELPDETDMP